MNRRRFINLFAAVAMAGRMTFQPELTAREFDVKTAEAPIENRVSGLIHELRLRRTLQEFPDSGFYIYTAP